MIDEKGKSFYYCTNCEQKIATLATGVCPLCNSQAVMPVGWGQVSTQERTEWFKRIHGGRRSMPTRSSRSKNESQETGKSDL
ncbi:MAG: hypothetical protein FJ147_17625 [Deltaproteobacteria bacterium]|nr:hypothetical protein [Deltaproteobacteria bacterium]